MEQNFTCPATHQTCKYYQYCSAHRYLLSREDIVNESDLQALAGRVDDDIVESLVAKYCSEERLLILASLAVDTSMDLRSQVAIGRISERIESRRRLFS